MISTLPPGAMRFTHDQELIHQKTNLCEYTVNLGSTGNEFQLLEF